MALLNCEANYVTRRRVCSHFNDGLNFDGKNFDVRLLWKKDHSKLENNYAQAVKRLESIEMKVKRDPENLKLTPLQSTSM